MAAPAVGRIAAEDARPPCLQRAQAFLQAFLERAANGHPFADPFHLRAEREWWPCASTSLREFFEGKARVARYVDYMD